MSFFGNLFGKKSTSVDIDKLNLHTADSLVLRVSNMLTAAGLDRDSNFNSYVDRVIEVTRRYQELDVSAMSEYINKVDETPVVSKRKKTSPASKKTANKKEIIVEVTPAEPVAKAKTVKSAKRVYKNKTVKN